MHSEGCRNRMKEISREKDLERYNAALERNMEWMSKSKREWKRIQKWNSQSRSSRNRGRGKISTRSRQWQPGFRESSGILKRTMRPLKKATREGEMREWNQMSP